MRTGTSNLNLWRNEQEKLIGLSLGWDFTAEHEWGIEEIQQAFGLETRSVDVRGAKLGLARLSVTDIPPVRLIAKGDTEALLVFDNIHGMSNTDIAKRLRDVLTYYTDKDTATAWDKKSFAVRSKDPEVVHLLKELHQAFAQKDAVIFLGGGDGPFANRGLVIAIKSLLPEEFIEEALKSDKGYRKMLKAATKTGIKKRLEKAGIRWYALKAGSVMNSTKDGDVDTKHSVMFFLNPMDQQHNNSGWYTVEQLDQWIAGEGPIPKGEK